VREVVQAVRRNLKVAWTKPHRDNVKAGVQSAVKMVLRRKGVKADQFDFILNRVMEQAKALYSEWPMVA
jgi:glutaredoxin-related protein